MWYSPDTGSCKYLSAKQAGWGSREPATINLRPKELEVSSHLLFWARAAITHALERDRMPARLVTYKTGEEEVQQIISVNEQASLGILSFGFDFCKHGNIQSPVQHYSTKDYRCLEQGQTETQRERIW